MKISNLFSILFIDSCVICKERYVKYCNKCSEKYSNILPTCFVCEQPSANFETHKICMNNKNNLYPMQSIYITEYNGIMKKLIYSYKKYGSNASVINKTVNDAKIDLINSPDLVIVVKSHRSIFSNNNSALIQDILTEKISKLYPRLKIVDPLSIDRFVQPQKKLDLDSRYKNIKKKINLRKSFSTEILENKNLLIIDDVLTSGATTSRIIQLLSAYNVKTFTSLYFAKELIV